MYALLIYHKYNPRVLALAGAALCILALGISMSSCHPPEEESIQKEIRLDGLSADQLEKGQHLFRLQCARCHGMEGGGGIGPALNRKVLNKAPDDATLQTIIQNGIPGTEMPGTWLLTPPDVRLVAAYVRTLGQSEEVYNPMGDIQKGKIIYETKGACRTCHMIGPDGGSLGPELTRVGTTRSANFIRNSLIRPGFYKEENQPANSINGFVKYLLMEVTRANGERITGMRINEDAFSLQLKDDQNNFYSFNKSDLTEITKLYEQSFMPSVKDVLTEDELEDLLAYLISLK